jgi:hypothetical protein
MDLLTVIAFKNNIPIAKKEMTYNEWLKFDKFKNGFHYRAWQKGRCEINF